MTRWLFDSHTHCYTCFDLDRLLDSAWAQAQRHGSDVEPVLGLVLTPREVSWVQWQAAAKGEVLPSLQRWQVQTVAANCLLAQSRDEAAARVWLIAGAQRITAEKLELLILGSADPVADSAQSLIWHVEQNPDLLHIAPWGVGKWLGARGAAINEAVRYFAECPAVSFMLGDNGGRPTLWQPRWIPQFKVARAQQVALVPGTDPLPIAGAEARAGSNGVLLEASTPEPLLPALQQQLAAVLTPVRQPVSLWQFVQEQVALRRAS